MAAKMSSGNRGHHGARGNNLERRRLTTISRFVAVGGRCRAPAVVRRSTSADYAAAVNQRL